jgi:hypothetical protein
MLTTGCRKLGPIYSTTIASPSYPVHPTAEFTQKNEIHLIESRRLDVKSLEQILKYTDATVMVDGSNYAHGRSSHCIQGFKSPSVWGKTSIKICARWYH